MDPLYLLLLAGAKKNPESSLYGVPRDIIRMLYDIIHDLYTNAINVDKINVVDVRAKFDYCENHYCRDEELLIFPEPSGIDINMMPFKLSDPKNTLPEYLHHYIPLLNQVPRKRFDDGIEYLTIHESNVKKGETQRRSGIHIEAPVVGIEVAGEVHFLNMEWGSGAWFSIKRGGIYMANNVDDTCGVWNVAIDDMSSIISNDHESRNGLDFLKWHLDKATTRKISDNNNNPKTIMERYNNAKTKFELPYYKTLKKNRLYWINDRTPHHSLPVKEDTQRTFFRVVTGDVGIRWTEDATPNDLVELPSNIIIRKTKFK